MHYLLTPLFFVIFLTTAIGMFLYHNEMTYVSLMMMSLLSIMSLIFGIIDILRDEYEEKPREETKV